MKKITKIVLILTLLVIAVVAVSPLVLSRSSGDACSYHGSQYYQYLDILEDDSANQIPTTLNVGQIVTVKVGVLNDVNTQTYSTISSVSLTLSSVYGHFQVSNPTYSIGSMPAGTATATWQINGTSDGYDYIEIHATGYNSHAKYYFSDTYQPYQLIAVGLPTGPTPPQPTATPAPPSTPTPSTSQPSSTTPTQTSTPAPTNTPSTSNPPSPKPSTTQTELSIEITSPTQGIHWPTNSKQTIQWQANGGTGQLKVKLEYIINSQEWLTLATDLPASGSYQWTTPDTPSTCAIRATVHDSSTSEQSTTTSFEVEKTEAFNWTIIAIAGAVLAILIVAIVVFKMRAKKTT